MDVVWLKRDARVRDHEPLSMASSGGRPFMVLYMYEPDQLLHDTVHGSHIAFLNEGLVEMEKRLVKLSGHHADCITTRYGQATDILDSINAQANIARLLSHEETGHNASYERDKSVAKWCRANDVVWIETPQATVVRGLSLRDPSWRYICDLQVSSFLAAPEAASIGSGQALTNLRCIDSQGFLTPEQLGLQNSIAFDRKERQRGGESKALELLSTFLDSRGERYAGSGVISSPNSSWTQCSRLSTYLSWGQISTRTVVQAVKKKQDGAKGQWARSLEAFLTRMEWRRVRIQDFEMRCWMEHASVFQPWENLREGYTFMFGDPKLLGNTTEQQRIQAFEQGRTGYPMVDACMRCLLQCGWLNFRMRCMLASFATFNLWLDWCAVKGHLARCFLDYEPGIHYVQLQLHAGTFGGMCHCYNVTKQAKDHDPDGFFIRKYVPELASVTNEFIHEPWKLSERPSSRSGGRRWASHYPMPIVNDRWTAAASRKVIEEAQKKMQDGHHTEEDSEGEDALLQLALKASMGYDFCEPLADQDAHNLQAALSEVEEAELKLAIEASLASNLAEA